MNIPIEVIEAIAQTFAAAKTPKTVKTRPCRIKFNGEFITTSSKKTVWRNKAFAKSALLNHLCSGSIAIAVNKYILTNIYWRDEGSSFRKAAKDKLNASTL